MNPRLRPGSPLRPIAIATVIAALAAAVLLAAFGPGRTSHARDFGSTSAFRGTPLDPPKVAADALLTDASGRPARILDPRAGVTFLFFGYTHCPDACPLAMASLAHALRSLSAPQAARTRVVFVTVDPKRDVPPVVARYVTNFDPRFVGLTGSRAELEPVWRAYGVAIDPRTREIAHGDAIYAIDATAHVVLVYPPSVAAADLAADAAGLTGRT